MIARSSATRERRLQDRAHDAAFASLDPRSKLDLTLAREKGDGADASRGR